MKRTFTPEQDATIENLYVVQGWSESRIAEHFGTKKDPVTTALARRGVAKRKHTRTHTLNEAAFDNAESSPIASYFVGLLFADGYVSDLPGVPKRVAIGLSGKDGEHVKDLAAFVGSSHKITTKKNTGSAAFVNRAEQTMWAISSERLATALARYGIVPRKSATASVPDFMRNNLFFWIGVVCGDGWVFQNKNGEPHVGLCGSFPTVQQWCDYLHAVIGSNKKPTKNGPNCWRSSVSGAKAVKLTRLLFSDAPFSLPRKLAAAQQIMEMHDEKGHLKVEYGGTGLDYNRHDDIMTEHIVSAYEALKDWNLVAKRLNITPTLLRRLGQTRGIHVWYKRKNKTRTRPNRSWSHLSYKDLLKMRDEQGGWGPLAKHLEISIENLINIRKRAAKQP